MIEKVKKVDNDFDANDAFRRACVPINLFLTAVTFINQTNRKLIISCDKEKQISSTLLTFL